MDKIRKILLLTLFTLSYTFAHSQYIDPKKSKERFGFIHDTDQRYNTCTAETFTYRDSTSLVISPMNTEGTPFQFYITFGGNKEELSEGFYTYDMQEEASARTISTSFVRRFTDWGNTYYPYQLRNARVYIQRFDGNYLISGKAELDTDIPEHIQFIYYGPVKEETIEVQRVLVFDPNNYLNNKGQMQLQTQTISTPCAFQKNKGGMREVSLIDKILFEDKKLEYGVFFKFATNDALVPGEFTSEDIANPIKATFFNQGKIIHPESSQLTVKYNSKKREYTLNYQLALPDNQTLRGTYKGKIPEDEF